MFGNLKYLSYYTEDVLHSRIKTSDLFFRGLSIVNLISFISLLIQFNIFKKDGIIPFKEFASKVYSYENLYSFLEYPSIFWLCQDDWFILFSLLIGIIATIPSILGHHEPKFFFLTWLVYLSFVSFGRDLFLFPWDTFLLEISFISLLCIYYIQHNNKLPRLFLIVLLLLFFRQWGSMAITKLFYSDSNWHDLTFMKYFWVYQPSPTPISLFLSKMPMFIHVVLTFLTLLIETLIPISMLFGKKGKILAFILSFILSISIQLTGNFGIFNILTINLSIWLLTDSEIRFKRLGIIKMNVKPNIKTNKFIKLLIINILMLNIFYLYKIMFNTSTQKNPLNFLNYELAFTESNSHSVVNSYIKLFSNFKIVSPHGVFKYIPNERKTLKAFKRDSGSFESISLSPNRQQNTIFYFEAPYMDRINYYCFYQSLGSVFWDYYNLNDLKYYMPSFGESLLKFHFNAINKANENGELNELILINTTFNIDEKIEVLKIDTILFKTTNDIENFTKNFSYYKYHVQ